MTRKGTDELMLRTAADLAASVGADAVVSFTSPHPVDSEVPVIWVHELQAEILGDLTPNEILDVSERQMLEAAVHLYLSRTLESGTVVAVFPHAIILYDIEEGKNFIGIRDFEDIVPMDVMHAVLGLAQEIATEGREGRSVGTAFLVGDADALFRSSHQMIINPYQGQPQQVRDIRNRDNWESIKEFAQLDGVFIIDRDGCVAAAGRHIDADLRTVMLPPGLGGRHRATAAITRMLPVVGVTVSESGGLVRVFRDGVCRITVRSDVRFRR